MVFGYITVIIEINFFENHKTDIYCRNLITVKH